MPSSSQYDMLMLSKKKSYKKTIDYDCITLFVTDHDDPEARGDEVRQRNHRLHTQDEVRQKGT